MAETRMVVRNISDTARWAAVFRADESQRPDALFRDPFAARLAGSLGVEIADTLPEGKSHAWAWVARTYLFDQFIEREIQHGVDVVLNLAAGLDARPYRMQLPPACFGSKSTCRKYSPTRNRFLRRKLPPAA